MIPLITLLSASVPLILAAAAYFSPRANYGKLERLLAMRNDENSDLTRDAINEAIDRCALKIVHSERVALNSFWRVFGLAMMVIGLISMIATAGFPQAVGLAVGSSLSSILAIVSYLILVAGALIVGFGTKLSFSVLYPNVRDSERAKVDELYDIARRSRHQAIEKRRRKRLNKAKQRRALHVRQLG